MPGSLFDGFIEFNKEVMRGLDEQQTEALRYRWLLGEITELLKVTHRMVVEELDRISQAKSLEEARVSVDRLRNEPLSQSFHAEGLCDAFVGLGYALSGVNERTQRNLASTAAAPPLFGQHLMTSQLFAAVLSEREAEVAAVYGHEIGELRDLLWGAQSADDLTVIQGKAARAKGVLTDQIADFDALAQRFKKL